LSLLGGPRPVTTVAAKIAYPRSGCVGFSNVIVDSDLPAIFPSPPADRLLAVTTASVTASDCVGNPTAAPLAVPLVPLYVVAPRRVCVDTPVPGPGGFVGPNQSLAISVTVIVLASVNPSTMLKFPPPLLTKYSTPIDERLSISSGLESVVVCVVWFSEP